MLNSADTRDDWLALFDRSDAPHLQFKSITEWQFQYYKTIADLSIFLEMILDKNNGDLTKIRPIFDQIKAYLNWPDIKKCMELLIDNKWMITLDKNLEHIFYGNYGLITKKGIVGKSVENILRLQ